MSQITEKAVVALKDCESKLRRLVGEAAEVGSYGEIARLTEWARKLGEWSEGASRATGQVPQARALRQERTGPARRADYPKFFRSGDNLVKIGWSKKHREEYTHKAPLSAVQAVLDALSKMGNSGSIIPSDELLPVCRQHGQSIPDYQTYLTLGWLRHKGVVERHGRGGYSVSDVPAITVGFGDMWDQMPEIGRE